MTRCRSWEPMRSETRFEAVTTRSTECRVSRMDLQQARPSNKKRSAEKSDSRKPEKKSGQRKHNGHYRTLVVVSFWGLHGSSALCPVSANRTPRRSERLKSGGNIDDSASLNSTEFSAQVPCWLAARFRRFCNSNARPIKHVSEPLNRR